MANKEFWIDELKEAGKLGSEEKDLKWRLLYRFLFIICGILLESKLGGDV